LFEDHEPVMPVLEVLDLAFFHFQLPTFAS
jgi:hypothetical protein